jgi:pimeloyl-ACP methyl ester carboxylesterase
MSSRTSDVVVLVPGFLGFSRVGGFYYFAERCLSVIRGALEVRLGRVAPVVPCCTLPAGRLVERQKFLLDWLVTLAEKCPGVERFHLVGHSAGGLDGYLLTCQRPLFDGAWGRYAAVRAKIASVATIASPIHGTRLVSSDVAEFFSLPERHLSATPMVARLLWALGCLAPRVAFQSGIVDGVLSAVPATLRFANQLVQHRELIADLAPEAMAALHRQNPSEGRVPVTNFVTTTLVSEQVSREASPFFLDLRDLTAGRGEPALARGVEENLALLSRHAEGAIRARGVSAPRIDATVSDGVVNSVYQILDAEGAPGFGGIFVADHADVLGHYDREDALSEGPPLNGGLFHSASRFGDDQFFELYRRIAVSIARAAGVRSIRLDERFPLTLATDDAALQGA